MLPVKKIYIDSRHSTSDTQNSSNFKIELDRSYKLPNDTVFFITDVCIPHSWMTVETGSNDNIYFMASEDRGVTFNYYIATMVPGVYDGPGFKTALSNAIYSSYTFIDVEYTASNNKLTISVVGVNRIIKIFTDKEIPVINKVMASGGIIWHGGSYSGGYPATCNENIQNFTPLNAGTTYVCNFLNLQFINNVYITSPNLSSYDTVSSFTNNIIKKSTSDCKLWLYDI